MFLLKLVLCVCAVIAVCGLILSVQFLLEKRKIARRNEEARSLREYLQSTEISWPEGWVIYHLVMSAPADVRRNSARLMNFLQEATKGKYHFGCNETEHHQDCLVRLRQAMEKVGMKPDF